MPNVTLKRMSSWHCCSFINSFRHFQCCFLLLLLLVNVSKYSFPNDFVWFISVWCSSTSHCNSPLSLAFSLSPLSLSLFTPISMLLRFLYLSIHHVFFLILPFTFYLSHPLEWIFWLYAGEWVCVCLYACYASFHSISFCSKIITKCRINQQQ